MFAPELKDAGITPTRKHVFPRIAWPLVLGRFSRKKGHSKTIRRDGRCPRPADLLCIRNKICRGPVILYCPFMTRTK